MPKKNPFPIHPENPEATLYVGHLNADPSGNGRIVFRTSSFYLAADEFDENAKILTTLRYGDALDIPLEEGQILILPKKKRQPNEKTAEILDLFRGNTPPTSLGEFRRNMKPAVLTKLSGNFLRKIQDFSANKLTGLLFSPKALHPEMR